MRCSSLRLGFAFLICSLMSAACGRPPLDTGDASTSMQGKAGRIGGAARDHGPRGPRGHDGRRGREWWTRRIDGLGRRGHRLVHRRRGHRRAHGRRGHRLVHRRRGHTAPRAPGFAGTGFTSAAGTRAACSIARRALLLIASGRRVGQGKVIVLRCNLPCLRNYRLKHPDCSLKALCIRWPAS